MFVSSKNSLVDWKLLQFFFCHQSSHFVLTDLQQSGFQHRTCVMRYSMDGPWVCVLCLVGKTSPGVPGQRQQQMREAEHQSSHENPLYILLLLQADPYEMESSFLSPPLYLTPSSLTNPFLSFGQSLLPKVPSYCTTVEFTLLQVLLSLKFKVILQRSLSFS